MHVFFFILELMLIHVSKGGTDVSWSISQVITGILESLSTHKHTCWLPLFHLGSVYLAN